MPAARPTWWGWHQLADDWAKRLVEDAGIRRGTLVLDVGAGTGAITKHLVAAGARVIAFELHPRRAEALRQRFAGSHLVKVVQADAADLRLPGARSRWWRTRRSASRPPCSAACSGRAALVRWRAAR